MLQKDDWRLTDELHYEHGRSDPFAAAVRGTRMPMVITDRTKTDNPIVFCNEAFQSLTGYSREESVGRNCRFLQGPETDAEAVKKIRDAISRGQNIDVDILNYRKDGSSFWNALHLSGVRNEKGDVQFFFASQLDITDRIHEKTMLRRREVEMEREVERRTAALNAALEEKTLLLHELDHRVKNNLMMISSMFRLTARKAKDPQVAASLNAMLERVDALSTVHRQLYQTKELTQFDIGAFAASLTTDVVGSSGRNNIRVQTDVQPIFVHSSRASALGLVLNEILTNAIKHAYSENRGGLLSVKAYRAGEHARIEVEDDGPGLDGMAPTSGLGMMLIRRLSKQAGAKTEIVDNGSGAHASIQFVVDK